MGCFVLLWSWFFGIIIKIEQVKETDLVDYKKETNLVAYEESAKQGEISLLAQTLTQNPKSTLCAFGPEGGFAPDEIDYLNQNDFLSVGLGPRIMRAETAPMYFLSVLSYKYELTVKWGTNREKYLEQSWKIKNNLYCINFYHIGFYHANIV